MINAFILFRNIYNSINIFYSLIIGIFQSKDFKQYNEGMIFCQRNSIFQCLWK